MDHAPHSAKSGDMRSPPPGARRRTATVAQSTGVVWNNQKRGEFNAHRSFGVPPSLAESFKRPASSVTGTMDLVRQVLCRALASAAHKATWPNGTRRVKAGLWRCALGIPASMRCAKHHQIGDWRDDLVKTRARTSSRSRPKLFLEKKGVQINGHRSGRGGDWHAAVRSCR